jgi:hypothetical protein
MSNIRYIEEVFQEFAHHVDMRQISVQPQDIPAISSFQNVVLLQKPLTRAQSAFVLKILHKYKVGAKLIGLDYFESLDSPTWRHPFRVIDHSKHVCIDHDDDGNLKIFLKFPYSIKEKFEKEFAGSRSIWDPNKLVRVMKINDVNVIALKEFCEDLDFSMDQNFVDLCDSVEEIWEHEENFVPYSIIENNVVRLINANENSIEYFEQHKTNILEEDLFLAKSMNFCLKTEEKNLSSIQKIAVAKDNYFYTNSFSKIFEILKTLPTAKVAVIVDRTSETLNFIKKFVNSAEKSNFPKNDIRVCFRLTAEEDKNVKFNDWIRENHINGSVDTGRIFIFRHKPAKWLFASEENVKIIVTNQLFNSTNISISHWIDSHPCVIFIDSQKPTLRGLSTKERKIVDL